MPIQPIPPVNITGAVSDSLRRLGTPPSSSGDGSRQSKIPPNRTAYLARNMVRWFIPETGVIDMYINPQNIVTSNKKVISNQRTKGGYVLQYWGEELTNISIKGTTGSSGIEGINVLEDVYRSEQVSFDPFALALAGALDSSQNQATPLGDNGGSLLNALAGDLAGGFVDQVANAFETGSTSSTRPSPTLASLAFSVEMYWSGWTYRGYFTDFVVTESADKLGLFDYTMTFMATQRRGHRKNFLGWHRSPTAGPSNSDPYLGVPYSYGELAGEQGFTGNNPVVQPILSTDQRLSTSLGYVGDPGQII